MNQSHNYTLLVTADQGWSSLLQEFLTPNGFAPVCSAQTGDEALILVSLALPRLVLLDLRLPGSNAVDLCTEMWRVQPAIKVILLTDHAEETPAALLTGQVAGCINRNVPLAAWPGLLTYALLGGAVFGGRLLGALLAETWRAQKNSLDLSRV